MAHFTDGNDKLKYTGKQNNAKVFAFDLPAQKTCPRAGQCKIYCYASVGRYTLPSMVKHTMENLEWTRSHSFVSEAVMEIKELNRIALKSGKKLVLRLHSSGDFYSVKYAQDWADIAQAFLSEDSSAFSDVDNVFFYAYSKSWAMIKDVQLPPNLFIIPSSGGQDDHLLRNRPHAKTVPVGYIAHGFERMGNKDDLRNVQAISDGMNVCLEAHGARKGSVVIATE